MTSSHGAAAVRTESPLLDHLLQASSRTFALTIPLLGEPTRREVTVAYLLFRVADSLEDSTLWAREKKLLELEGLARFLERPSGAGASDLATRWVADPPLEHAGYVELLRDFPEVMRAASAMSPQAFSLVASHTARTCRAMAAFVAREEQGVLRLRDLADLKAYCYAVAGIVGEMLTELFLLTGGGVAGVAADLRRDAAAFGEALQLVNILKDTAADAVEGRHYLPDGLSRSQVFSHARLDLGIAAGYCGRLESVSADRGIVAFTALPILLARATLDRVEERGPGAKITRAEVTALVAALHEALARGAAARLFEIDPGRRPERGPNG